MNKKSHILIALICSPFIVYGLAFAEPLDTETKPSKTYYYWIQVKIKGTVLKPKLYPLLNGSKVTINVKKKNKKWKILLQAKVARDKIVDLKFKIFSIGKNREKKVSSPRMIVLIHTQASIQQKFSSRAEDDLDIQIYSQKKSSKKPPHDLQNPPTLGSCRRKYKKNKKKENSAHAK